MRVPFLEENIKAPFLRVHYVDSDFSYLKKGSWLEGPNSMFLAGNKRRSPLQSDGATAPVPEAHIASVWPASSPAPGFERAQESLPEQAEEGGTPKWVVPR